MGSSTVLHVTEFQYNCFFFNMYFYFIYLKILFWEKIERLHQTAWGPWHKKRLKSIIECELQENVDFSSLVHLWLFISFAQKSTTWQDLTNFKNNLRPDRTLLLISSPHLGIHPLACPEGCPSLYSLLVVYSQKELHPLEVTRNYIPEDPDDR